MAIPIAALALGGGALLGGLGGLMQRPPQEVMPTLQNPNQYNMGLNAAQGASAQGSQLMNQLLGQAQNFQGQGMGFLQNYMQSGQGQFDPMAAQRAFLAGAPQLQQLARQTVGDTDTGDFLRQEQERIRQEVGDSFGGTPTSGAFAQALGTGIASPLLQRGQAREQMIANLAGNMFGQSQGLLNQNFLQQSALQQAGLDRMLGQYNQQAGTAMQGAQMGAGLQQAGLGMLGQLTQPVYATPDYVTPHDPFQNFLRGATGGLGLGANIAQLK